MKLTNKHKLPSPIVKAVEKYTREIDPSYLSVTQLIDSPRIRMLRLKHWHEIVEDASERLWVLLGSCVHEVLEKSAGNEHLSEEYLEIESNDLPFIITGRPDLLDNAGNLDDYKVTSVWSLLIGVKKSWEQQLNVYRWLYQKFGFEVKRLRIYAILRDWNKNDIPKRGTDYPPCPFIMKEVEKWDEQTLDSYIDDRLKLHRNAQLYPDDLPKCTSEEMWEKPTIYSVKKKGAVKSLKNYTDLKDAEKLLKAQKKPERYEIEKRVGRRVRCESYCNVSQFCDQYKAYLKDREDECND